MKSIIKFSNIENRKHGIKIMPYLRSFIYYLVLRDLFVANTLGFWNFQISVWLWSCSLLPCRCYLDDLMSLVGELSLRYYGIQFTMYVVYFPFVFLILFVDQSSRIALANMNTLASTLESWYHIGKQLSVARYMTVKKHHFSSIWTIRHVDRTILPPSYLSWTILCFLTLKFSTNL